MKGKRTLVHCITNPVTMQDTANILLAAGSSAIMAEAPEEAAEITALSDALLLNTGVPSREKLRSCIISGKCANAKHIPVVLDPVGVGASNFRREQIFGLLHEVQALLIRCNIEEAMALLDMEIINSGGVDSFASLDFGEQKKLAQNLAEQYRCIVLLSGTVDAVSDGKQSIILNGGDPRIRQLTGGGCMLSALCAMLCGEGLPIYDAAVTAGKLWRKCTHEAGARTDSLDGCMGSFHCCLFDETGKIFADWRRNREQKARRVP